MKHIVNIGHVYRLGKNDPLRANGNTAYDGWRLYVIGIDARPTHRNIRMRQRWDTMTTDGWHSSMHDDEFDTLEFVGKVSAEEIEEVKKW